MNIIPSYQSQFIYDCAFYTAEKIETHTKKLLGKTYIFIQSQPGAYLTIIAANMISFEIALRICRLINNFFSHLKENEDGENQQQRWKFTLLFSSIIVGSMTICCKTLNLPLSSWKVIGVSFTTNIIYLIYKNS
ncbi:MAG TPA: hypothetical protein PKE38_16990 [Ignavibacteriaceae bacterium]|nr:hypothetical protein [Ignavibacteriaceae bacterium]